MCSVVSELSHGSGSKGGHLDVYESIDSCVGKCCIYFQEAMVDAGPGLS